MTTPRASSAASRSSSPTAASGTERRARGRSLHAGRVRAPARCVQPARMQARRRRRSALRRDGHGGGRRAPARLRERHALARATTSSRCSRGGTTVRVGSTPDGTRRWLPARPAFVGAAEPLFADASCTVPLASKVGRTAAGVVRLQASASTRAREHARNRAKSCARQNFRRKWMAFGRVSSAKPSALSVTPRPESFTPVHGSAGSSASQRFM